MSIVFGSTKARKIAELDLKTRGWLQESYSCPLCFPDDEGAALTENGECVYDLSLRVGEPDLDCPLCDGGGEASGFEVAEWALLHEMDLWLLPAWFPREGALYSILKGG